MKSFKEIIDESLSSEEVAIIKKHTDQIAKNSKALSDSTIQSLNALTNELAMLAQKQQQSSQQTKQVPTQTAPAGSSAPAAQ